MPIRFSLGLIAACFFCISAIFADRQAIDILKRWVSSSEYVRYQTSRDDISLSEKAELISQAETLN